VLSEKWISQSKMTKTLKTSVLASGFWRLVAPRWHLGALWVSDARAGRLFRIDRHCYDTVAANLDNYPDRRQTARVETTTVDVPGAANSMRFAQTCSH
jgi:hypothetical protein